MEKSKGLLIIAGLTILSNLIFLATIVCLLFVSTLQFNFFVAAELGLPSLEVLFLLITMNYLQYKIYTYQIKVCAVLEIILAIIYTGYVIFCFVAAALVTLNADTAEERLMCGFLVIFGLLVLISTVLKIVLVVGLLKLKKAHDYTKISTVAD